MASIPQEQISDAYYYVKNYPNEWYSFGRGYRAYGNKQWISLFHYGTKIYHAVFKTGKFEVGGFSQSDVNAINSMAYHTGIGGAYIKDGVLYAKGTGPKYVKKTAKKR